MPGSDWRFQRTKLDPTYSGMDKAYNQTLSVSTPRSRAQFESQSGQAGPSSKVTAASRFIPSPSNTNWSETFGRNGAGPASPSGTDFRKTFGGGREGGMFAKTPARPTGGSDFSFNLAPSRDQSQFSLGTDITDFYKERIAGLDLTKRDHELYGAGADYGFDF